MGIRFNIEEVKRFVEQQNFELVSENYDNCREKITIKDNEDYLYSINFFTFKKGFSPNRFGKGNEYTFYNLKIWLSKYHAELKLVDNLNSLDTRQKFSLIDTDGYLYSTNIFRLITKQYKLLKFHVSNPHTIYNVKLWCVLNKKQFTLISETYKGSSLKLKWQCLKPECGEVFECNWSNINIGDECSYCSGHQVGLSNCLATKHPDLAEEWHPTKNGELTPYDVTLNSSNVIWWQCKDNPKHVWKINVYSRNKGSGCPFCSGRYPTEENNLLSCNPELCEEWDYTKNGKSPEDYTPHSGKSVWWKCKECGHEWKSYIYNRHYNGCPECAESKGEIKIREWLKCHNIIYIPQKEFEGLIGLKNGNLSYDFYISKFNFLIEFQGEQHERYIKGFHQSKKDFEKQQEHDRRKKEYAQEHNIRLLEIWYYDFDNIESILEKELLNNG